MSPSVGLESELRDLAERIGLSREQTVEIAAFYRRQVDDMLDIAAELVAEHDRTGPCD